MFYLNQSLKQRIYIHASRVAPVHDSDVRDVPLTFRYSISKYSPIWSTHFTMTLNLLIIYIVHTSVNQVEFSHRNTSNFPVKVSVGFQICVLEAETLGMGIRQSLMGRGLGSKVRALISETQVNQVPTMLSCYV